MPGPVHHWTDQIVHAGIDNNESARRCLLDGDHPREQDAGGPHQPPARLHHQFATEAADLLFNDPCVAGERQGRLVAIANAEPAAEIETPDGDAIGLQHARELGDAAKGAAVRVQVAQLRADMHRNPFHRQAGKPGSLVEESRRLGPGDTELVGLATRADLVERAGVHIGIDPERNGRGQAEARCDARQAADFRCALAIDLEDAAPERGLHFRVGLADAREDDLLRRNARCKRAPELTLRNDIRTRSEAGQQAQHRQVAVRLHRIADARRGQRRLEFPIGGLDGVGGIHIDGRADLGRHVRQPDGPCRQAAADIVEGPHLVG